MSGRDHLPGHFFYMQTITDYFPGLSEEQIEQFAKLEQLCPVWNSRINVISRQDIDHLFEHHILYSAGISKYFKFLSATKIMDAGTGGGFPGIPLAILFPDCEFCLVDSIGKKIKVVDAIRAELGLKNVKTVCDRFENIIEKFDFILGRSVMPLTEFYKITSEKISALNKNPQANGIIYLTGGDVEQDLGMLHATFTVHKMAEIFPQPFFTTKKIIHIF